MSILFSKRILLIICLCFFRVISITFASVGDKSPDYKNCFLACNSTGCFDKRCIPQCIAEHSSNLPEDHTLLPIPHEFEFVKWECEKECAYQCMNLHETFRSSNGLPPVQYQGKWPFQRIFGLQEPASVLFSIFNFIVNAFCLLRYLHLVYWKLPKRPNTNNVPAYDYTQLWTIYGLVSMNSWFWSAVFHSKDTKFSESLDYSTALAFLGYSFILATIRCGKMRLEAPRVMISAPVVAFTATHIMYMNYFKFDYGWNMKVCLVMGSAQLLIWFFWAIFTPHPAKFNVILAVLTTMLALSLEVFDFPPLWKIFDAHSIWHLVTVPISVLWWRFVYEDAKFCSGLTTRSAESEAKKVE